MQTLINITALQKESVFFLIVTSSSFRKSFVLKKKKKKREKKEEEQQPQRAFQKSAHWRPWKGNEQSEMQNTKFTGVIVGIENPGLKWRLQRVIYWTGKWLSPANVGQFDLKRARATTTSPRTKRCHTNLPPSPRQLVSLEQSTTKSDTVRIVHSRLWHR